MSGFTIITLGGSAETTASGVPIGFVQILTGDQNQPIGPDNPLAVVEVYGPSGKDPLLGNLGAVGLSPVAFMPLPGRPFNVAGVFSQPDGGMTVEVVKSYDDGGTYLPLFDDGNPSGVFQQTFSQSFMEPEAGVSYYLQMTERVAGNVAFRFSQ